MAYCEDFPTLTHRTVQAQLRRGEHIGLIFVQCWAALHSLCHRHGAPGLADPCAVLGKCDSRDASSLKPFFSCLSNRCRNLLLACPISSRSGQASMFSSSCGSGADCAGGGSGMYGQASRKSAYTMISLVILGYLRLCSKLEPQNILNWDISV